MRIFRTSLGNFFLSVSLGPTIRHTTFSQLIEKLEEGKRSLKKNEHAGWETKEEEKERERALLFVNNDHVSLIVAWPRLPCMESLQNTMIDFLSQPVVGSLFDSDLLKEKTIGSRLRPVR